MADEGNGHLVEYRPGSAFPGVIGRTFDASTQAWPAPLRAEEGSPNVLFIILDDTGVRAVVVLREPDPHAELGSARRRWHALQQHAHDGALLADQVVRPDGQQSLHHMAGITEISTGFPGYDGNIPFEHGFLSEHLHGAGYNTYAIGKWHLTPADQVTAAGPYDRWPLGRGFERYYGFMGGDTHQYYPELTCDNHRVEPERTAEEGYHLTEDLVDKAISFIADSKQVAPDKPFFMYFATGAQHAPHHVPAEWAERYAGTFDEGWDVYRERTFARQKELGLVPADAELSRHDPDVRTGLICPTTSVGCTPR